MSNERLGAEWYEALCVNTGGEVSNRGVGNYRVRTIKAGDMLEVEGIPIISDAGKRRALAKIAPTSEAQRRVNDRNTQKKIMRYMHANFTAADIWATFTFGGHAPDLEDAHRQLGNYIKRLKRYRAALKIDAALKYMYVISSTSCDGEPVRCHIHLVMSGDMDRDEIERLWTAGGRKETRRLQPDDYGLEGLARYIGKNIQTAARAGNGRETKKRFGKSTNLKPPSVSVADKKLSRKRVAYMAFDLRARGKEVFERLYPGYDFLDVEIYTSDFVEGAYIYARMHRRDARGKNDAHRRRDIKNGGKNMRAARGRGAGGSV